MMDFGQQNRERMCRTCVNANNYVVCSINIQDSAESEGCEFYQPKTHPCEMGEVQMALNEAIGMWK